MTAQRPILGIVCVLTMAACFSISDNLIKYLGAFLPVLLLLWARYAVQAGTMAVWLSRQGRRGFSTAHPKFQWTRGALLLITSAMSFFGLQYMPVAEFTALGMLTPVVVTVLAAWVLHEPVSRMRWALVCGGFVGAVIVIRPGGGVFGWAAVFPLLMALSYGAFQVLTSRLSSLESPYVTQFYTGFSGAVLVTPFLLWQIGECLAAAQSAPAQHLVLVLAMGSAATAGHLFLIYAFGYAPTATLMPFVYTQIAFALGVSFLIFRHVPDGWAWVGMLVIAACGGLSAWMNARQAGAAKMPASAVAADTAYD